MVVKEEISLLPSSVKSLPGVREGKLSIKRSFHWLLIATLALMFGWLVLLSVRSYQPVLSGELVRSLMRGQEVCETLVEPNLTYSSNRSNKIKILRHVTDASQLVAKSQRSKATLSSVAKPLGTRQASAPLLPTLTFFGREVW